MKANGGFAAQRRVYRKGAVNRGEGEANEENKYDVEAKAQRQLDEYVDAIKSVTQFFTTEEPELVLEELEGYFGEKGYKVQVSPDKYKLKVGITSEKGELLHEANVLISKVEQGKYAVEFKRTQGDALEFVNTFNVIKEQLDLEDVFA